MQFTLLMLTVSTAAIDVAFSELKAWVALIAPCLAFVSLVYAKSRMVHVSRLAAHFAEHSKAEKWVEWEASSVKANEKPILRHNEFWMKWATVLVFAFVFVVGVVSFSFLYLESTHRISGVRPETVTTTVIASACVMLIACGILNVGIKKESFVKQEVKVYVRMYTACPKGFEEFVDARDKELIENAAHEGTDC